MDLPESLEHRYIDVRGKPMHYVASVVPVDPAPTVVLVHGVGLSYRYMVPTAELLVDDFRVYVPDLPGFGKSYKPWRTQTLDQLADALGAWMDAVHLENAVLLGNSVGCQIIVKLAVRHPDKVLRAVLQGPTVDPEARTFRQQLQRWRENRKAEGRRKKGPIVVKDYWECGPRRLIRTFGYALQHRMEEDLPRMRCPTLVVRGELDPIVPQRWAEEVERLLPQGRLILLGENVSHTANFEAPEELVRVTKPFFEEERSSRRRLVRRAE